MPALGATAWEPKLTPNDLFQAANFVHDEESADWLRGMAHDLAVIRNLPETEERP